MTVTVACGLIVGSVALYLATRVRWRRVFSRRRNLRLAVSHHDNGKPEGEYRAGLMRAHQSLDKERER